MRQTNKITSFDGREEFLSNFWYVAVEYEGETYPTIEHAFQAAKTLDPGERHWVKQSRTPGVSKRRGRNVTLRADWESIKVAVMEELLRQKFDPYKNPHLFKALMRTIGCILEEGNTWGDKFWGLVQGIGRNELGKLLMKIRQEFEDMLDNPEVKLLPYWSKDIMEFSEQETAALADQITMMPQIVVLPTAEIVRKMQSVFANKPDISPLLSTLIDDCADRSNAIIRVQRTMENYREAMAEDDFHLPVQANSAHRRHLQHHSSRLVQGGIDPVLAQNQTMRVLRIGSDITLEQAALDLLELIDNQAFGVRLQKRFLCYRFLQLLGDGSIVLERYVDFFDFCDHTSVLLSPNDPPTRLEMLYEHLRETLNSTWQ